MGIRNVLRLSSAPRPDYLASPWSEGQLQEIVWSDVFGADFKPMDRAELLSIPAVSKARDLICTKVAQLPLRALDSTGVLSDDKQPSWMYRTDGFLSPFLRMVFTLDDLLFYGQSLWEVVRGSDGFILSAERVPYDRWSILDGAILVNDLPVDANDVIYIPSHTSGILDRGTASLKAARNIINTVANRAASPIPVMEISSTEDGITAPEAAALVAAYNKARRDVEGATVFTPSGVTLIPHGDRADASFAIEGRNAARLDIANLLGVPAALLEGTTASASLTYSTTEGKRNEFLDYGLSPWLRTIESRLSQDDVVPRGQHVAFDLGDLISITPSPTGPKEQD
jgi:hypothetical protein